MLLEGAINALGKVGLMMNVQKKELDVCAVSVCLPLKIRPFRS